MKKVNLFSIFTVLLVALLVVWLFLAVGSLEAEQDRQGRQQLEDALRRATVACYAAEGIYPPDLEYLKQHYGLQINEDRYVVFYEAFAENLMPEITVLEKES